MGYIFQYPFREYLQDTGSVFRFPSIMPKQIEATVYIFHFVSEP